MKVIFLDFDGVITIPPKWHINADKIKYIKQIVDNTDAKIVVSSSWRRENVKDTINDMIGKTKRCPRNKMLYWLIDNLYDVTPWISDKKYNGTGRGGEIQTWLDKHPEVDNYVIIDDDGDMLDSQVYHFIQTDWQTGLTNHEVELAIKVLNNEYIYNTIGLNFILRTEWIKKCEGVSNKLEILLQYNNLNNDYKKKTS